MRREKKREGEKKIHYHDVLFIFLQVIKKEKDKERKRKKRKKAFQIACNIYSIEFESWRNFNTDGLLTIVAKQNSRTKI